MLHVGVQNPGEVRCDLGVVGLAQYPIAACMTAGRTLLRPLRGDGPFAASHGGTVLAQRGCPAPRPLTRLIARETRLPTWSALNWDLSRSEDLRTKSTSPLGSSTRRATHAPLNSTSSTVMRATAVVPSILYVGRRSQKKNYYGYG